MTTSLTIPVLVDWWWFSIHRSWWCPKNHVVAHRTSNFRRAFATLALDLSAMETQCVRGPEILARCFIEHIFVQTTYNSKELSDSTAIRVFFRRRNPPKWMVCCCKWLKWMIWGHQFTSVSNHRDPNCWIPLPIRRQFPACSAAWEDAYLADHTGCAHEGCGVWPALWALVGEYVGLPWFVHIWWYPPNLWPFIVWKPPIIGVFRGTPFSDKSISQTSAVIPCFQQLQLTNHHFLIFFHYCSVLTIEHHGWSVIEWSHVITTDYQSWRTVFHAGIHTWWCHKTHGG